MNKQNNIIDTFSKHLFWDVNKADIDIDKHAKYNINSILQYGFYEDWKILLKHYKLKTIVDIAIKNKHLDKKTASFIALISKIPINNFLCSSTKQLSQQHWNF